MNVFIFYQVFLRANIDFYLIYIYENNLPALLGFVLSFVSMLPDINGGVYCHVQMSGIDPDLHNQDIG